MIDNQLQSSRLLYSTMKQYHALRPVDLKKKTDSIFSSYLKSHPESVPPQISVQEAVERSSSLVANPWWVYFINFNPEDYLSKVRCPVLALNGTLDSQVRASANLESIGASLRKAGNKAFELHPMPQLNHMLQKAGTGSVTEYAQIDETVNAEALTMVSNWISKLK